ncbi:hypothetical protein MBLNU230_g5019t1 [Neophaeotheca triangularis]
MNVQGSEESAKNHAIDFCTLGMFIIDEIHPPPNAPDRIPQLNIIGGAGTYAALGARLFSPAPNLSRSISWLIDTGPDFPPSALTTIKSWQTSAILRSRSSPTTRGWNGYTNDKGTREFRYLTAKLRVGVGDLDAAGLRSRSFHLICNPQRLVEEVQALWTKLAEAGVSHRPYIVWEPVPDLCVPEQLAATLEALRFVDVVSPNHEELASLFAGTAEAQTASPTTTTSSDYDSDGGDSTNPTLETLAQTLVTHGIGPNSTGLALIRAGAKGVYLASQTTTARPLSNSLPPSTSSPSSPFPNTSPRQNPNSLHRWLPPYHPTPEKVLDPTGGGNTFLGAFSVGLVRNRGDWVEAAKWGNVGAGVGIEQVGVPELSFGEGERWNGVGVWERLEGYKGRVG